jgi:hypothetical protein
MLGWSRYLESVTTFLLQCGACLIVWMAVGIGLALRIKDTLTPVPETLRGRKFLTAVGLYVLSALVLLGGLFGVFVQRGIQNNALLPWAWLTVGFIGLVFVLLQLRATVLVGCLILRTGEASQGAVSGEGSVTEASTLDGASK